MPDLHEVPNGHEGRIGKLEGEFDLLSKKVDKIGGSVDDIGINVQRLVTSQQVGKGKFDIQTTITILGAVGAFAAFMIGVYLSPLQSRQDSLQTQMNERFGRLNIQLEDISKNGSVALQLASLRMEKDVAVLQAQIVEIKANGSPITRERLLKLELIEQLRSEGRLLDAKPKKDTP